MQFWYAVADHHMPYHAPFVGQAKSTGYGKSVIGNKKIPESKIPKPDFKPRLAVGKKGALALSVHVCTAMHVCRHCRSRHACSCSVVWCGPLWCGKWCVAHRVVKYSSIFKPHSMACNYYTARQAAHV